MFGSRKSLTPEAVHKALGRFYPAKNDDFPSDYGEELAELRVFGITTEEQLDALLHRRTEEIMEIDRSPMSESEIRMHTEDSGEEFVASRLREGFWFSFPALLRIALELEFGETYEAYADKRDGIVQPGAAPNHGPGTRFGGSGPADGSPSGSDAITQYPASYLCDIMYGVEPMTREIAAVVRQLRVERGLSYSEVGRLLSEAGNDPAICFQIGRSFSSLAAAFLHEKPEAGWL